MHFRGRLARWMMMKPERCSCCKWLILFCSNKDLFFYSFFFLHRKIFVHLKLFHSAKTSMTSSRCQNKNTPFSLYTQSSWESQLFLEARREAALAQYSLVSKKQKPQKNKTKTKCHIHFVQLRARKAIHPTLYQLSVIFPWNWSQPSWINSLVWFLLARIAFSEKPKLTF